MKAFLSNTVYKSGIREGVWMLGLSCFIVPVFIEFLLREQFDSFFRNGLYAGTTMCFIMAIVFMLGFFSYA